MCSVEDKIRELLVGKTIQEVNVKYFESHGVASVTIITEDNTTVDLYARERNGGGYIAVDAGDDVISL